MGNDYSMPSKTEEKQTSNQQDTENTCSCDNTNKKKWENDKDALQLIEFENELQNTVYVR